MSHKRELRKVDIFGHSPRGKKPGIKNSRLSETGARAGQKLWTFSRNFCRFSTRRNITVFLSKFAWNLPRKKFWSLSGCREPKSLKTTGFDNPLNTIKLHSKTCLTPQKNHEKMFLIFWLIFFYFCFADYLIFLLIFSCFFSKSILARISNCSLLDFFLAFSWFFLKFPATPRQLCCHQWSEREKNIPIRWNDLELSSFFFVAFLESLN